MTPIPRSHAALLALALLIVGFPQPARACGPFFEVAIFSYTKHPDMPLDGFARGDLGVLRGTYARSYLVAAYRYLSERALDPREQKDMVTLWTERLSLEPGIDADAWVKPWLDARGKVGAVGPGPTIDVYRSSEEATSYVGYVNYNPDAFSNAARTLGERITRFGAGSQEVKDWVAAQDKVFANSASPASIPAPAAPGANALVRADRAYQIASAHFYAAEFDAAAEQFGEIARDNTSPWSPLAPYLVARAYLRKGTLTSPDKLDTASLERAEAQLRTLVADKRANEMQTAARRLLSLVELKLHPQATLASLAAAISGKAGDPNLKQNVWDYTAILDRLMPVDPETGEAKHTFADLPNVRQDDMTDWVLVFQATDAGARDYAMQRWEATHSVPWLVSAIAKADPGSAGAARLLDAAGAVAPNNPAYLTVAYHQVRLLAGAGRAEEARVRLDGLLAHAGALPPSVRNLLLAERTSVARNLAEFLKYAQRVPATISISDSSQELPADFGGAEADISDPAYAAKVKEYASRPALDEDGAAMLNAGVPLATLVDAAAATALAPRLRREVALSAWVRAALLGDTAAGARVGPIVAELAPELKEHVSAYSAAATPDAKRFAVVFAALRFPGLRPYVDYGVGRTTLLGQLDQYRDNWWCPLDKVLVLPPGPKLDTGESDGAAASPDTMFHPPSFLGADEKAKALGEWHTLVTLGTAPNYLAAQAVAWVQKNSADARAAEALALAVRASRYGCTDEKTTGASKAAFQLLHQKYPQSEWAKKTKYYF